MKTVIGLNDDYSCIYAHTGNTWDEDTRKVSFYYGYEHQTKDGEWCFVARKGEATLMSATKSELIQSSGDLTENDVPAKFLIHGMYLYTQRLHDMLTPSISKQPNK